MFTRTPSMYACSLSATMATVALFSGCKTDSPIAVGDTQTQVAGHARSGTDNYFGLGIPNQNQVDPFQQVSLDSNYSSYSVGFSSLNPIDSSHNFGIPQFASLQFGEPLAGLDTSRGQGEYKVCPLGPEGFPPPVRSAVVIRDGKLFFDEAAILPEDSSSFLIEFYSDDLIAMGMVNTFNALLEEFPDEKDQLTELFEELYEEVSSLRLNGGNVEELKSFNKLYAYGAKIRGRVESAEAHLERLKNKEESFEISQITNGIASNMASMKGSGRGAAHFDNRVVAASTAHTAMGPKISAQQTRIDERKRVRSAVLDLFDDLLIKLNPPVTPEDQAVARGSAAAIAERLGDKTGARLRYKSANHEVALNPNPEDNNYLLASYYELQSIRLMPEDEGDDLWKAKVKELDGYIAEVRSRASQAGNRIEFRDGPSFNAPYEEREEAALRAMKAEALMLKVGLYVRNDMESDDKEYEDLMWEVKAQMRLATRRPASPREAKYLALSLAGLDEVRVQEAAEESRVGDLDLVGEMAPLLDDDVYLTEKMYEAHGFKDSGLAAMLHTAYYSLYHQSGLPIDAVYTWFHKAYTPHKDLDIIQEQADLIEEKAPHFFDGALLKARSDITPPANGKEARELEANLHITNGGMAENMIIGGASSIGGSVVGAKTMASAGVLCGPFAEICVPAGGIIGGIGGFFFGEEIIRWRHSDEIERMESQAELAGVDLLRVTPEESRFTAGMSYAGLGLGAVMSGGFGGWATKGVAPWGFKGASELIKTQGLKGAAKWVGDRAAYAGREIVYEAKHTVNYLKGGYYAGRGFLGFGGNAPKYVKPGIDEAFELIYARMSPGQLRRLPNASKMSEVELKQAWRQVFDNLADHGDTVLLRGGKPLENFHFVDLDDAFNAFHKGLKPDVASKMSNAQWRQFFNDALTKSGAKLPVSGFDRAVGLKALDDFLVGRVGAMKSAVADNVPELMNSRLALMGRKELLRQAFRQSQGFDQAMANELGIEALAKMASKQNKGPLGKAWSAAFGPKTQKLYRLGMLAAAADYAFVEDTTDGYELRAWDGEIDTGWGVAGYIAGTGYYSTRLGINTHNGGILGGGTKAITFVGFQGLSGLALADSDIKKIAGAQDEYLFVLPATLLLYSGMHAKGGKSTILNAVSQTPFARRIPSLTAYTSAYGAHSLISKPSFIRTTPGVFPNNLKGMGVSLGHTIPYIMGVTAVTGKELLGSDPYFVGQRGWKFAAVGLILNPLQIALGGDTGVAQGAARGVGILFDMIPAISMSPYYNNRFNINKTLLRMAGEKGPGDSNEEFQLFMSDPDNWMASTGIGDLSTINRTFDVGGWMNRDSFDITNPGTYNFGWRWEPDGVKSWLDAMEGWDDYKRSRWIEGAAKKHPELYADLANSLHGAFENPEYWTGSEHRTRGMLVFSTMAKWYAQRYRDGETQFAPFAALIDQAPETWRREFWDKVPQMNSRDEMLKHVSIIQDKPIEEVQALLATSYGTGASADK